jgi:hypothetical protein
MVEKYNYSRIIIIMFYSDDKVILDCGYSICKGRGGVGWGGKDDSVG